MRSADAVVTGTRLTYIAFKRSDDLAWDATGRDIFAAIRQTRPIICDQYALAVGGETGNRIGPSVAEERDPSAW
jgi:hypothetical protein